MGVSKRLLEYYAGARNGTYYGNSNDAIRAFVDFQDFGNLIGQLKAATGGRNRLFHDVIGLAGKEVVALMQAQIKNNGSVDDGILLDSIRSFTSRKNPDTFIWIGPDYRRFTGPGGGYHAHLVEYGTKERYMKRGLLPGGYTRSSGGTKKFSGRNNYKPFAGKWLNKAEAKPFIRPVIDVHGSKILDMLYKGAQKAVVEEFKKRGIR